MTDRGRFWVGGVAIIMVMVVLYLTREILLPFVAGMAVAYILDPTLDRLEKIGLVGGLYLYFKLL